MIQMPSGPGGDSPAQNAVSIEIEEHNPPQLYDGITIPPNELEDISGFGMLFSQVDGGNDDCEKIPDSKEANPATSTDDTSTVIMNGFYCFAPTLVGCFSLVSVFLQSNLGILIFTKIKI